MLLECNIVLWYFHHTDFCAQEEENRLREELRQEWELKQEKIKSEYQYTDALNILVLLKGPIFFFLHFLCLIWRYVRTGFKSQKTFYISFLKVFSGALARTQCFVLVSEPQCYSQGQNYLNTKPNISRWCLGNDIEAWYLKTIESSGFSQYFFFL